MELFRLFGSIIIDDQNAIDTLKKSEDKAKASSKAMNDLSSKASAAGKAIAVGFGAAVTSLGGLVKSSMDATDRIDKLSQSMGMSAEGFQEWDYILGQNGVSIDSMKTGMKTLTNMTDDLRKGSALATDTFDRLGISVDDLAGKSQEDIFSMTIQALTEVEDETERAALANDLLGKSGADLAPLLNQGSDAVETLRQNAHDLGLIIEDDAITAGVKLGDTWDDVQQSFGAIATKIGNEVMPIVQEFFDWLLDKMPVIQETASKVFNAVADAIKWVSDNASWIIPVLAGMLGGFIAFQIISTISSLFTVLSGVIAGTSGVMGILNAVMAANPFGLVVIAIAALIAAGVALWMNWDKVKEKLGDLWDSVKSIFTKIKDFISGVWDSVRSIIKIPSIKIEGDLNPLTWLKNGIPKFSVNWNADGAIFTKPAIFDTRYGYQGVGEAGPEVVMPLSKLDSMLSNQNTFDYDLLAEKIAQTMNNISIVLDKDQVGTFIDKRIMKGAY